MQSFYHFPRPGPETEAQKERRKYIAMAIERSHAERREKWRNRARAVRDLFRM